MTKQERDPLAGAFPGRIVPPPVGDVIIQAERALTQTITRRRLEADMNPYGKAQTPMMGTSMPGRLKEGTSDGR